MSQVPPTYTPSTSFASEAELPIVENGLPGAKLDGEFASLQASVNQTISRLSEIQRDDGRLANGVVTREALGTGVATGINPPKNWAASTPYAANDSVIYNNGWYWCMVAHTSGSTWAANAAKWQFLSQPFSGQEAVDLISQYGAQGATAPFNTWNFTTNGAASYSLSSPAATLSASGSYIVTLGGIVQAPSTYTVSPSTSTITFTSTPPTGLQATVTCIGYPRATLAASVTTNLIVDGAVTADKIAYRTITNNEIGYGALTTELFAESSVDNAALAVDAVSVEILQDGCVSTAKLANNSVTAVKIADQSITSSKLSVGAPSWDTSGTVSAPRFSGSFIGTLIGNVSGSVTSANKLTNSRSVTLTGAITGSGSFDGTADLSIATTFPQAVAVARAWLNMDGTFASKATKAFTRSGTTITVTSTAHGLTTGQTVTITSFNTTDSNLIGTYKATVLTADTFTIVCSSLVAATSGTVTYYGSVRASYNVASVIRNGTGDYTLTFINEMTDTLYAVTGSAGNASGSIGRMLVYPYQAAPTKQGFRFCTTYAGSGGDSPSNADHSYVSLAVFGN